METIKKNEKEKEKTQMVNLSESTVAQPPSMLQSKVGNSLGWWGAIGDALVPAGGDN